MMIESEPPMVERVVDQHQAAELGAMSMMLMSIPPMEDRVDGIAVYPGLGETWRVEQAVGSWENTPNASNLLVAGTNPNERTHRPLDLADLQTSPFNLTRTEGVLAQSTAANTPAQAEWLADQVEQHDLSSISFHVSPYHMLRAYCTTLKTFQKRGLEPIPIIPRPTRISPTVIIPETGVDAAAMYNGEAERIRVYQGQGDVATLGELKDHIEWMWQQPILGK